MFLLHLRFSRRYDTECHDLPMTNVMSSRSSCFYEAVTAAEAVTRSGGSVLKAPQRRRGGTPPRSETAKLRKNPYLCILMREKPRVFSPHGEEDTGS